MTPDRHGDEFQGSLLRAPGAARADAREWRQWLAGGSSREVLARIVSDDPLAMRAHVSRALLAGAYLLDAQRVLLRSFALVARGALRYRGRPALDDWLQVLAREAITAIVREDSDREKRPIIQGREPGREHGEAFAALAKPLGLEPDAMGRACLAFNRLPREERAVFFALVIEGRTLEDLVRKTGESATDLARRARRALDAILTAAAAPAAGAASLAAEKPSARETARAQTTRKTTAPHKTTLASGAPDKTVPIEAESENPLSDVVDLDRAASDGALSDEPGPGTTARNVGKDA